MLLTLANNRRACLSADLIFCTPGVVLLFESWSVFRLGYFRLVLAFGVGFDEDALGPFTGAIVHE